MFDHGFDEIDQQPTYFLSADNAGHAVDGIGNMLFCERLIATFAFADAQGFAPPGDYDLPTYKDELIGLYSKYGVTSGVHESLERIKDIERQGQALSPIKSR